MTRRTIASRVAVLAFLAAAVVSAVGLSAPLAIGAQTSAHATTDAVVTIYTKLAYQGSAAAGTGIVIGSNGLVLTNNHVIRGATTLRATDLGNGRTYTATVLGYSVSADVALIQLKNASGLQTATIGGATKVGDAVTAYGNGGGNGVDPTGASGTVRGLARKITAGDGEGSSERLTGLIQTDVALEPGDSGGPLVDSAGRLVGMNVAASTGFTFGDYGQAAPRPTRSRSRAPSRSRRRSRRARAPRRCTSARRPCSASASARPTSAASAAPAPRARSSARCSPARRPTKAGIPAGSLITALGTKKISSAEDLSGAMLRLAPKSTVAITWVDEFGNQLARQPPAWRSARRSSAARTAAAEPPARAFRLSSDRPPAIFSRPSGGRSYRGLHGRPRSHRRRRRLLRLRVRAALGAEPRLMSAADAFGLAVALALFAYLVYALFRGERF